MTYQEALEKLMNLDLATFEKVVKILADYVAYQYDNLDDYVEDFDTGAYATIAEYREIFEVLTDLENVELLLTYGLTKMKQHWKD